MYEIDFSNEPMHTKPYDFLVLCFYFY